MNRSSGKFRNLASSSPIRKADTSCQATASQQRYECMQGGRGLRRRSDLQHGVDLEGARRRTMKRLLLLAAVSTLIVTNVGCFLNAYNSDPELRTKELINQSENLRQIQYEWERIWFTDMPSHLTPERVDGGI
jgi:hypothetical protein